MHKGKLFVGTSNVVLPGPKRSFPVEFQSRTRLGYYSTLFNSVELNSTFYKVARPETFVKWAAETPLDFRFTIKLTREITHQKQLLYDEVLINHFMQASRPMGVKKGCLLVQFPASITRVYFDHVHALLKRIQKLNASPAWLVFVEFRDASWYDENVYAMLAETQTSIVQHDKGDSRTPEISTASCFARYVRFHGPHGDYRGTYTPHDLAPYAAFITEQLGRGQDVYAYFNNTIGTAFDDAQLLRALCGGQSY